MPNKIVFMDALARYHREPHFKGSVVKEYLLMIQPEEHVQQLIAAETDAFRQRFALGENFCSTNRITVASFLAKEEMEETLLRWMHRIFRQLHSFDLHLNNYSGHPSSATVFLRVQDHQPFKVLAKELRAIDELVKSNGLPAASIYARPQLPIACGLEKSMYEQAMPEYSRRDFHASFTVQEMLLVKRLGKYQPCEQVSVFGLQP